MECTADDCDKPATRGGLCYAHEKRKARGKDMSAKVRDYGLSLTELRQKAALRYADASELSEAEYKRADDLMRKYATGKRKKRRL